MLIIAHRGASAIYPENTHQAFTQALSMGAHGLELDIQCSNDGQAIVFHDESLERMTSSVGRVVDHTLEELQRIEVEGGESILSLHDMFNHFAGETTLWLEVKDPHCLEELCHTIAQAVATGKARYDQCIIIGFDVDSLIKARARDPQLYIGYSVETMPDDATLTQHINAIKPAYLVAQFELASEELVHRMAAQGIQIVVWTLNEINDSLRMQQRGVAGIITDIPNILCELFHG